MSNLNELSDYIKDAIEKGTPLNLSGHLYHVVTFNLPGTTAGTAANYGGAVHIFPFTSGTLVEAWYTFSAEATGAGTITVNKADSGTNPSGASGTGMTTAADVGTAGLANDANAMSIVTADAGISQGQLIGIEDDTIAGLDDLTVVLKFKVETV